MKRLIKQQQRVKRLILHVLSDNNIPMRGVRNIGD